MKHVSKISLAKCAVVDDGDASAILDQIFAFVQDIIDQKGKGEPA